MENKLFKEIASPKEVPVMEEKELEKAKMQKQLLEKQKILNEREDVDEII